MLFTGDAALLEAAKKGNLARVQKLATQENINCRDTQGRNSTPLHLAGQFSSLESGGVRGGVGGWTHGDGDRRVRWG